MRRPETPNMVARYHPLPPIWQCTRMVRGMVCKTMCRRFKSDHCLQHRSIAQSAEQPAVNRQVPGSSPVRSSICLCSLTVEQGTHIPHDKGSIPFADTTIRGYISVVECLSDTEAMKVRFLLSLPIRPDDRAAEGAGLENRR